MLVTPTINARNRLVAAAVAAGLIVLGVPLGLRHPAGFLMVLLAPAAYWWLRRTCQRRLRAAARPFPPVWEGILRSRVAYFRSLDAQEQQRFRQLVQVFLDEVRITGVRTEVDETVRVLVAASAIIPVFRFDDWEYSRLGEVLIYPASFDDQYRSDGADDRNTLGMVGVGHLRGVMILSKPALLTGFDIANDKANVGIHEFAHLVDAADGAVDGIPPGVPAEVAQRWIHWIGEELAAPPRQQSHIRPYAYTNEAEYFAVLVEYFFEAPEVLQQKNPELYRMLSTMFRQDTAAWLPKFLRQRTGRVGRNSPCPCGSGKKYKKCCRRHATRGVPR